MGRMERGSKSLAGALATQLLLLSPLLSTLFSHLAPAVLDFQGLDVEFGPHTDGCLQRGDG